MVKSVVFLKRGENGYKLAYELLQEMGADEILSRCKKVLLKPNLTAEMPAATGVTSHPSVVEAVLRFTEECNVKDVVIGEGGGCDTTKVFDRFGFSNLAKKYGAQLVDFNRDEEIFLPVAHPLRIKQFSIARTVTECDCIVNLACLKIHTATSMVTLAMKNMMGCIARDRGIMHEDFNEKLMDLLQVVFPSISIIDGIVGRERGEIEGNPVDAKVMLASRDPVAVDAVGATVMGFAEGEVGHIALAEKFGFGNAQLRNIEIRGVNIKSVKKPFKRAQYS